VSRVLVTGASGLLGAAIVREFTQAGMDVHALCRADLDITAADAVDRAFDAIRPQVVVNCAAFNDVDGAERHAAAALSVNSLGVLALVRAAARGSAALVHYSSDFVFDGENTRPYTEQDEPRPRSNYAMSKLLGEWLALESTPEPEPARVPNAEPRASSVWVLRVESLFGAPAPGRAEKGSVHGIVSRIKNGEDVPVFVDRTVSPTYTADIARATRALVDSKVPPGIYHCVNSGAATWPEVAEEAGRILGLPVRLQAMTLESANLKAPRPRYCALSNAKLASAGIHMPPWQDALARYVSALSR
jgi:dTDP-4-dehydrorhamnose reductase